MMDGPRTLHTQVMVGRYGIDHIKVSTRQSRQVNGIAYDSLHVL